MSHIVHARAQRNVDNVEYRHRGCGKQHYLKWVEEKTESLPLVADAGKANKIVNKRAAAERLYKMPMYLDLPRKEMIKVFVEHLGLTQAGASTYYSNCKKKFG